MEIFVSTIIVIGILALIATVVKYPKDVGNGVLGFLFWPFERIWGWILLILFPIGLLVLFIEGKLGKNFLTKYINKASGQQVYKTSSRKPINFPKFKKYIIINSVDKEFETQITEANATCPEVDIGEINIVRTGNYSVVELPKIGFFGYNLLIQWLTNELRSNEVFGFSSNGRTSFLTQNDTDGDNNMKGLTNTGKKFWLNMYEDLDQKQFLRLNNDIELSTELTTETLDLMVKNAM